MSENENLPNRPIPPLRPYDPEKDYDKDHKTQAQEIKVVVDNEQTKKLAEELAREKLKNEERDRRISFDLAKKELADQTGDNSFLDAKSPEELKAKMESLLAEAVNARNKRETPSGSAPLNSQQYGIQQQINDLRKMTVTPENLMRLRALEREGNQEAIELEKQLWAKAIQSWRSGGHLPQGYSPDDNIIKQSGTPDLNFDDYKPSNESELRKMGIKTQIHGYSKTHNRATGKENQ